MLRHFRSIQLIYEISQVEESYFALLAMPLPFGIWVFLFQQEGAIKNGL